MKVQSAYAFIFCSILLQSCDSGTSLPEGLSPEGGLQSYKVADGFKIELIASEPLVADPVAMEIDENGLLYVVEMHGYPLDLKGSGVIKILEDSDNDGRFDKSVVFADSLVLPTGITRWKKGVLVTDPPLLYYFEDTDGDHKADVRKIMLSGFARSNPQHNVNTPVYGLDNWIYIAHEGEVTPKIYTKEFGDLGAEVKYVDHPASSLPLNGNGRSIRIKPDSYAIEMLSGQSQFGQTFDPYGHIFGTSNANHLFNEVIAARYLDRNPYLRVVDALQMIPDHGDAAEVFPITTTPAHQLLTDIGVITSSCGVTWYTGGLFDDSFNNVTFIAEPVHNLVHADIINDKGATFVASRKYDQAEFLASTDSWSRPVNFYIGPDGALYVIDYYRQIIEHPEWMAEEVAKSGALYNGSDKGRIYRITPTDAAPMNWPNHIELGNESNENLVQHLADRNRWWRIQSQRLLLDRSDDNTVSAIHHLLDSTSSPLAWVHAIWTLDGIGKIDALTLDRSFHHSTAGVRENAIRIAEKHLDAFPSVLNELHKLRNDPSPKVRFQLMCTLGSLQDKTSEQVRQQILEHDMEDNWVQLAALSASSGKELNMIMEAKKKLKESTGAKQFFENCASVIALSNNEKAIEDVITIALHTKGDETAWWRSALFTGLEKGLTTGTSEVLHGKADKLFVTFSENEKASVRTACISLLPLTNIKTSANRKTYHDEAEKVINNPNASLAFREDALRVIGFTGTLEDRTLIEGIISPTQPESIQKLAIETYAMIDLPATSAFAVKNWKQLTSEVREEAIGEFLSDSLGMVLLLDAISSNQIQPTSLNWPQKVELMNHDISAIRNRARELLIENISTREDAIKKYKAALNIAGVSASGERVFQNSCAICHQIGGKMGKAFGPDLATIRNRDPQFILADIINPNRAIADGYEGWKIQLKNNTTQTGLIVNETSSTITLRMGADQHSTIPRTDIQSIEAIDISAMPEGLENGMSVEDMANLLAYLKESK